MSSNVLSIGGVSVGLMLSLALLTSCKEDQKQAASQALLPPADVEVTKVQYEDVDISEEWIGSLRGTEDAEIRAQVSGYLISKNYKDGSYVKKGDVLFQIDKRPFEAALQQAKGVLAQHEASAQKYKLDVSRYGPLAERGAVGVKQLDDSKQALLETEAAIVSAKASVQQAEINLQFTTITAPISGLTGLANPSIGNLLSPSAPEALTTISAIDPIRVDFSISEKDLLDSFDKLRGDGVFEVLLSNGNVYPYKGKAVSLDRNVSKDTGTINVVGHIPNPDHLLRPGMFVRVKAVTKTLKHAALVPPRAIMSMQSMNFVVLADPETKMTSVFPVIPGPLTADGRLQVINPLRGEITPSMNIVVEGLLQALQRSGGKGTVNIREYVDKLSQPVVVPKEKKLDDSGKPVDEAPRPEPAK